MALVLALALLANYTNPVGPRYPRCTLSHEVSAEAMTRYNSGDKAQPCLTQECQTHGVESTPLTWVVALVSWSSRRARLIMPNEALISKRHW